MSRKEFSKELLKSWIGVQTSDKLMHKEMLKMQKKEFYDAFKTVMHIKNSALIKKMGAGLCKINIHTISAAALAYAKYLQTVKKASTKNGIIIVRDNSLNSRYYSEEIAKILINLEIPVFVFEENKAQPIALLSYTIKKMNVWGGIFVGSNGQDATNGLTFLEEFGEEISSLETKKIDNIYQYINPILIKKSAKLELRNWIGNKIIAEYFFLLSKLKVRKNDVAKLVIKYYAKDEINTSVALLLIHQLNYRATAIKNLKLNYFKTILLNAISYKNNVDLIAYHDSKSNAIKIMSQNKHWYKKFNYNDLAIMTTTYILNHYANNKLKIGKIYGTYYTSAIINKVAEKFNVKYDTSAKNFAINSQKILTNHEKPLLIFSQENKFIFNPKISATSDSLQMLAILSNLANYLKTQNQTLSDYHEKIFKSYGYYLNSHHVFEIEDKNIKKLITKIKRLTFISAQNIIQKQEFIEEGKKVLKIYFGEEKSWLIVRRLEKNKLEIFSEIISTSKKVSTSLNKVLWKELKNLVKQTNHKFK